MHHRTLTAALLASVVGLAACGSSAATPSSAPASVAAPASAKPATSAPASAAAKPSAAASGAASAKPAASGAASAKPAASGAASAKPAASGAASAAAGGKTKMVVSYSNIITNQLPIWMAKEAGVFDKNGLDVDVQNVESTKGIPALIAGELQVANLGGSEAISAGVAGADLVVTSVEAPVFPFVFQVPASIKAPADLKGKKVGVSAVGSTSDIATRLALPKIGLEPDKDVTLIAVGSLSNRVSAMLSGAIQGGVSTPPDTIQLEAQGFHTLFDLSTLGIPVATSGDVLLRSYATAHKDVVQKYIDSVIEAGAMARKDKAAAVKVMQKYFKSDDANAMGVAYDYFEAKIIPALPYPKADQFTASQEILAKNNDKVASFDVSKIIDDSYVKSAADRGLDK